MTTDVCIGCIPQIPDGGKAVVAFAENRLEHTNKKLPNKSFAQALQHAVRRKIQGGCGDLRL